MAETLKGLAVVWGCGNLTMTGVAISSTTGKMQNYDFTRDGDIENLMDSDGETIGRVFFNTKKTLNITVLPSNSSTIATAVTNLDAMLPAPGTVVTVADGDAVGTVLESGHSGAYLCESARLNRTNNGAAVIDMTLVQYDANDTSATIS